MSSSNRRSLSRTPSSSPRTLRRLRSTPRRVQWSISDDNHENSTDKNEPINPQPINLQPINSEPINPQPIQLTSENQEDLTRTNDLDENEMTPCSIIDSLSLSHQKATNTTTNKNSTTCNSPLISTDEENDKVNNTTECAVPNSKHRRSSKKKEILSLFDEWENGEGYKCKLCSVVRILLIIVFDYKTR
jgi:hypothetical protein